MGENTMMTPADIAAINGGGMNGGNWMWIVLFIALFGMNGFGGFGGGNYRTATAEDVNNGFNFAALERQNNEIVDAVRQGVYDTTNEVKDIETMLADGFARQQTCCCETLRSIDGIKYDGAINTASINANTTAQTQRILDALAQDKIETLQNKIQTLEMQNAMCGVVRYPNQMTWNAGGSPFCGCHNGCGM